ncbi:MAG: flagellar protein FliT [Nitrosomonadales bacterium]|nr:MAG: flagellar protein FliT [Nitrosomonadales bacterium]
MQAVEVYREISKLSQGMLEFARQEQWDDLLEFEKKRAESMAKLIPLVGDEPAGNAAQSEEMILLIRQIQAFDEETASLTRAWMSELGSVLNSLDSSKKLQQAYKEQ